MSRRKFSDLATAAASPALDFAAAVDHGRRLLVERLAGGPQMVAVIEIDGPFVLFANYGPGAAATLHAELHERLRAHVDTVIAIGAFRFLLISPARGAEEARELARNAMEATSAPFEISGDTVVALSVAGAMFLHDGADALKALQRTALALNEARRRGRRLLMGQDIADAAWSHPGQLALRVEELERALARGRLRLALQPVIGARSRQVLHHEALLRVIGDDGVARSAAPLIAAAEAMESAYRVDLAVLAIAARTLDDHPTMKLAVNVSAASARDQAHSRLWLDRLASLGPDTARLTVELTETAAPGDVASGLAPFAAQVRQMGASFSVDDFGSGYTSYSNLMTLKPDEVKIDGAFVKEVHRDPRRRAFVRALVAIAGDLGIRTVAEWVETAEDAETLTALGVDALQGFYFGEPRLGEAPRPDLRLIA